jgi:N-ethylmaleimide reductase
MSDDNSVLFSPTALGALQLPNRLIMAPLTRCRAIGHLPNRLMAEYYSQRATAGLVITECTMVTPNTSAFGNDPGIYSPLQIDGWRQITDAVHQAGGRIFMQIWHAGRAAHPLLNHGQTCVAPSAIAIDGETHTPQGKQRYTVPQPLDEAAIDAIVENFRHGAANAIAAGFDGVEVHGANGYLIDQFLRSSANQRHDSYGGSLANRARFLFNVLEAVSGEIGSDRVGLRLSPLNSFNSMRDDDPAEWMKYLASELNRFSLAYLHLIRGDFFGQQQVDVVAIARAHYRGHLMVNMGYSAAEAAQVINTQQADSVAFGTAFLANPDLPARIRANAPLNTADPATFYTDGAAGYTDYPPMMACSTP